MIPTNRKTRPHWTARLLPIFMAIMVMLSGCARYEARPLKLNAFLDILEQRDLAEVIRIEENPTDQRIDPSTLTHEQAEWICLLMNPQLNTERIRAKVPEAAAEFAGLWDDPELGLDAMRILESVSHPWILGTSVSFTLPISGRLRVAVEMANAEARAAWTEVWASEQVLLGQLRQTWADWQAVEQSVRISEQQHERLQELIALTDQREALGEMIAAEAVTFRLAGARLQYELETLRARRMQLELEIRALLGLHPQSTVTFDTASAPLPASFEFSDEHLNTNNPQVRVAAAHYEVAEQALRLEIRRQYPDLTIGPAYGNEDGTDRLGLGVSLPLPILNANRQGIAVALAQRESARAAWEGAVKNSLTALHKARASMSAARSQDEMLTQTIIPLAARQMAEARKLAELGEIDVLLILEAIQADHESALRQIETRADVRRAMAELQSILPANVPQFDAKNLDSGVKQP